MSFDNSSKRETVEKGYFASDPTGGGNAKPEPRREVEKQDAPPVRGPEELFSIPNPRTGLPAFTISLGERGNPMLALFDQYGNRVLYVSAGEGAAGEGAAGEGAEGAELVLGNQDGEVMASIYAAENGGSLILYSPDPGRGRDTDGRLAIGAALETRAGGGSLSLQISPDRQACPAPLLRIGQPE